jgi:hypothetical protein
MRIPIGPEMLTIMGDGESQTPRPNGRQPRIRSWAATQSASLAWIAPVVIVVITGALGSTGRTLLVATWLAAVGTCTAGVLIHIALEPAPYAARAASAVAATIGTSLLLFLAWQAGDPLLK